MDEPVETVSMTSAQWAQATAPMMDGMMRDLAASGEECERLRAQRDRLAELVERARDRFFRDTPYQDEQRWVDEVNEVIRDLDAGKAGTT